MEEHPHVALVQRSMRALAAGDDAGLADDVEWSAPGDPSVLPWAGSARGPEAVRRQRALVAELLDYEHVEITEWVVGSDAVAAVYRCTVRARATDRRFESTFVRLWTIRDGEIARIRTFYDTAAYAAALTSA